ncbi:MAG: metalloregulator ArsR/SmtB family transcription factor [Thermomicrobiales bacterium]
MGELVAGRPALRIETAVSLPLDMVSVLSLLYRAVPGSGLDPWLIDTRRRLSDELRQDLDLLHGFSGRLLYYPEEPVMRFGPLDPNRANADIDDLIAFMEGLAPSEYLTMVLHALERVHADLEIRWRSPEDVQEWQRALAPALTTARLDDVLRLITDPEELKRRTIRLYRGVWEAGVRDSRPEGIRLLHIAARRGAELSGRGFAEAYAALTGQRVPDVIERPPASITRVVFCPSLHLGQFVSYIAYGPDLIVYFPAPQLLDRCCGHHNAEHADSGASSPTPQADLLEAARALADPTRLRMIDLLLEDELYAQEIVGRLGVAQSAVSRHLAQLERAGLVTVSARRGSKFYTVNPERLDAVAEALRARGASARARMQPSQI